MATRPTREEIKAEISALRALKPFGQFASKTTDSIAMAVSVLETGDFDDTCEEWTELSDDARDICFSTKAWLEGDSKSRPSMGWEGLAK